MKNTLAASFLALSLALALPRAVSAETPLREYIRFEDGFSSESRVAGQTLVGLWLGTLRDKVLLSSVRLLLPPRPSEVEACVSVNTRDGDYEGRGIYKALQGPSSDWGELNINSRYKEALKSYSEADFGVRAELKPDCSEPAPGVFVPAVAGGPLATLVALINGQRAVRVSAELRATADSHALASARCTPSGVGRSTDRSTDRSTAFDTICRFSLPPALAGDYVLVVTRLTRAGDTDSNSFRIGLAPAPQ
ncbi:MAG: hypothetical protein JO157_14215 [Acetobacteraceae bacterium]|nr:hypothetical protein [Acetobacteraceae bacterium]